SSWQERAEGEALSRCPLRPVGPPPPREGEEPERQRATFGSSPIYGGGVAEGERAEAAGCDGETAAYSRVHRRGRRSVMTGSPLRPVGPPPPREGEDPRKCSALRSDPSPF